MASVVVEVNGSTATLRLIHVKIGKHAKLNEASNLGRESSMPMVSVTELLHYNSASCSFIGKCICILNYTWTKSFKTE